MKGQGPDPGKLCSALPCRVGNWAVDTGCWLPAAVSLISSLCDANQILSGLECPHGSVALAASFVLLYVWDILDVWTYGMYGMMTGGVGRVASESSFLAGHGCSGASSWTFCSCCRTVGCVRGSEGACTGCRVLRARNRAASCELRAVARWVPAIWGPENKTGALD